MKNIIIHCEAQKLRNGNRNPKNYPWWPELLSELKDFNFIRDRIKYFVDIIGFNNLNLEEKIIICTPNFY